MTTLATLSNLNEAFLLRSMFEASEIPAFIPDENTCQTDWGYINAIGGVRVQIPEEHAEEARAVLANFRSGLDRDAPPDVIAAYEQLEEFTSTKIAEREKLIVNHSLPGGLSSGSLAALKTAIFLRAGVVASGGAHQRNIGSSS